MFCSLFTAVLCACCVYCGFDTELLFYTVYALIFRHSNYSSWAPKGMKSILIDDEIASVLILRQRP